MEVEQHAIRQSFMRIGQTLKHLPQDKQVFWFLLAFFCYIDGVSIFATLNKLIFVNLF